MEPWVVWTSGAPHSGMARAWWPTLTALDTPFTLSLSNPHASSLLPSTPVDPFTLKPILVVHTLHRHREHRRGSRRPAWIVTAAIPSSQILLSATVCVPSHSSCCCCCCCCRRRACVCVCVLSVWLLHHVNHKWTSGPVPYEQWDPPCPPGIPKHAQTTPTTRSFIPAAGLQLPATSASSVSAPHLLESQYLACPQPYQRAKWCQKPAVPPPAARSELSSGSANHHPSSVLEQPPDDLE